MQVILPELRRQTCKQSWSPFSHRNPVKTQTNEPNQHLKTVENFQKKKIKNPIDLGPKVQVREIKTGGILQRFEEKEEIGLDWEKEKEKEKVKWRACDDGWRDR